MNARNARKIILLKQSPLCMVLKVIVHGPFLSDSMIILWKLSSSPDQNANDIFMEDDDIQNKESWTFHKALR